ncbi:hypothetical protein ACFQ1S_25140, partial [Kibdelosporangium lantanae]
MRDLDFFVNLVITGGSPPTCRVGGCFVGSVGALNSLLAGFKPSVKSTSRFVQGKSYLDAMKYLNSNPMQAALTVAKETKLPAEVVYLYNGPNGMVTFDT